MKYKKYLFLPFLLVVLLLNGCKYSNLITDGATEFHHIFPRQFREQFAQKGIDVDDFTIALTKKDHRGMGKGLQYVPTNWNNEWNDWLLANPDFTQKQAAEKAQTMLRKAGCKGEFKLYNYNTKQLSKASVGSAKDFFVCSNNRFLKICGKLGYWLLKVLGGSSIGGQILAVLAALGCAVLGLFGIKAEEPVAVGVGLICLILGIIAFIGLIIFVKWLITLVIAGGGVAGKGVLASNN